MKKAACFVAGFSMAVCLAAPAAAVWDADYGESMIECALSGDRERGRLYERLRNAKIDALGLDAPYIAYDDLVLLAQVIHTEAGSAWLPDEWRLAVGEVVLNRVASPEFPDTLEEVVFQPGSIRRRPGLVRGAHPVPELPRGRAFGCWGVSVF